MIVHERTDVTVNTEGLWLLQALLDIRHVAPELKGRPYVSTGSDSELFEHPGISVMQEQGVIVDGHIHPDVAARMEVLGAPDIEVILMVARQPLRYGAAAADDAPGRHVVSDCELRIVLARRDERWVSAVRSGTDITVDDVSVSGAGSIAGLVLDALDAIAPAEPAHITAVTVPTEEAVDAASDWQNSGFDVFAARELRRLGLNPATLAALSQALSDTRAEAVVYARQHRDDTRASSESVLSIKDGSSGRIAMYQQPPVAGSDRPWMAICPATPQFIGVGVKTLLDTLPFGAWERHRR
ncbi:ESX secretion-associated protein EspG [Mycolicibacterium vinylchloridicum]|uniref:ESX secretion-associated protein EspG n=1 Tax=Mycolicibacterium vinylchloridicum TaxID=2736928 RepID=UPI0015C7F3AF|nr:ESX secretion-associated protein EspG [Mycolicibacterium vinylchloridicum]